MSQPSTALKYFGAIDAKAVQLEQLKATVEDLTRNVSTMQSSLNQVRGSQLSYEREFPDVVRQLDILAGQLEREKGDVAVLKEQLAFLALGGDSRGHQRTSQTEARGLQALFLNVMTYLYDPFLYFIRGFYVLVSPIVMTFRSLSVFNGGEKDDGESDDDDEGNDSPRLVSSSKTSGQQKHLRHDVGYLLTALGQRREPVTFKNTTTSTSLADVTRPTPQRGTELLALLKSSAGPKQTSTPVSERQRR